MSLPTNRPQEKKRKGLAFLPLFAQMRGKDKNFPLHTVAEGEEGEKGKKTTNQPRKRDGVATAP